MSRAAEGGAPRHFPRPPAQGLIEAGVLLAAELSLETLLQRLVEAAVRLTGARYGALGVLAPEGGIREFITVGLDAGARRAIGPVPSGRGILGALITDPRPLRLAHLQGDPRSVGFPPNHPPMTTFLGAPVRARGRVFGNLYLTEKQGGVPFDEVDEATVVTLAGQAGVAIANAETYADLERHGQWLAAIHRVTTALLAGSPREELMTAIVSSARQLAGADLSAIALPDPEGSSWLRVVAADGEGSAALLASPPRGSDTASHLVLETGAPQRVDGDEPLMRTSLVAGAKVPVARLLVVPLLVAGRVSGTISLTLENPTKRFPDEADALLGSFADQAAVVLEYTRAQERSLRLAVSEERLRIARDIHDEPVQALIHLARRLGAMASAPGPEASASAGLAETRELAIAIVDGLRQLTVGLRSETLDREGLGPALRELAREFSERSGIRATFQARGTRGMRLEPGLERDLLRVAQEALSNVERHSRASRVRIGLELTTAELRLRVVDDGVGYAESGPQAPRPGLGTLGMRERVLGHGGQLQVHSRPGGGVKILVQVVPQGPLPATATTGRATGGNAHSRGAAWS